MQTFIDKVALVTSANRGIGLKVARQLALRGFTTILAARDAEKGEKPAITLRQGAASVLAGVGLRDVTRVILNWGYWRD